MVIALFRSTLTTVILALCFCIVSGFCAAPASAEPAAATPQPETAPFTITVTPSRQFDAHLSGGGTAGVSRYLLDITANKPLSETLGVGLNFIYEFADYNFSAPVAFSGAKPWGQVHHLELGGSVVYDVTPVWSIYVAPTVEFLREDGAGWNNAVAYGGDIFVTRDFSPTLTLGLGAEVFDELGKVTPLPLVIVNWKINDRLVLANSSQTGPMGQLGAELAHTLGDGWEAAAGGAYKSSRFRLSNSGLYNGGVAEEFSYPAWGRISRKAGKNLNFDLYAGAMLGGELHIDDSNGNRIKSDRYDPAPFMSLAFSARF